LTALLDVRLEDKYKKDEGRIHLTGVQALVRLAMQQRRRDLASGYNTAGYVTGYRGSPLGAFDQQLQAVRPLLDAHHIHHQPAVNEDLAATACQGTQQVHMIGGSAYDGVFALWYGKGPGVDRSGDAIRHGHLFGTAPKGGVLLLLGDDHICESSTTAHQSEYAMVDAQIPVLNPATVREILDYGLLGIAMSRFTGGWVSLKCVHDTVECTASIEVDPSAPLIVTPPESEVQAGPRHIDVDTTQPLPVMAGELERRVHTTKLEAARAFARANRLDRLTHGRPGAPLCLVTTGKSWADVVAALEILGIDEGRAAALGLKVYKVGMSWPLEPVGLEQAMAGVELALVVEEKRGLIEEQMKALLYAAEHRPRIEGKADATGAPLLPSHGALDAVQIARAIAERLVARTGDAALGELLPGLEAQARAAAGFTPAMARLPYFCAGCPHSSSTRVPDGSRAMAGIGCHFMVSWMDRQTSGFTQMGGEGASWLGAAPFSERRHLFQNVGDGTFYHSGSMVVRAAVASGQNITLKILVNDAVAMTGGQKMEVGNLDTARITRLLEAEGVKEIAVVSDEPGKYPIGTAFAPGVRRYHRDELDQVQRRLREVDGVTAIVYDQTCAAEKRRRRKRGTYPDPNERILINELVCEGCGDCGVQSNCVAIQPLETEFGRKRRIDQSACNKDFSCLKGFCPSFVSIKGGKPRRRGASLDDLPDLPEPILPSLDRSFGILVTGIGGTGVITIAALLGMAAHLEGKGTAGLDMIGVAQKGGAVTSHLKLAPTQDKTGAPRLAPGGADLVLGCDMVVAAGKGAVPLMARDRTRAVVNTAEQMTGAFTRDADMRFPADRLMADIAAAAGAVERVDASRLAGRLLGDAIGANLMLVGYAWQKGWLPLSKDAILRAIEVNGVAVAFNSRAFNLGRHVAHDAGSVEALAGETSRPVLDSLDAIVAHRAAFLTDYQDAAYAERYRQAVARVRAAEALVVPGQDALALAAARYLFKLMAIKDEYEVARLYSGEAFKRQLDAEFESFERLEVHLAPPLLASRDARTGQPKKQRYGPWMLKAMRVLARLKGVRGTRWDLFGRTAERRMERQLLADYEAMLEEVAGSLTPANHRVAVELARLPEHIRGFGHVKERHVREVRAEEARLRAAFRERAAPVVAVAAALTGP
jgi:indolepyruvate ferredoxin oxidoreductase